MSIRLSILTVPKAAKEALLFSEKAYKNRLSRPEKYASPDQWKSVKPRYSKHSIIEAVCSKIMHRINNPNKNHF